ncbi:MAG: hypothetical protein JSS10_02520 [Verrucomicrobia bacterium]|nr:hypothetical protein [Verrucomicrobiota bacterium]
MKNYTWKAANSFIILTVALLTLGSSNLAWAKSPAKKKTEEKIKGGIDTAADTLKKGVEKAGDTIEDMQTYFRKKFHEQVTSGPATVTDVKFNGHSFAAIVRPGERIEGELKCTVDKDKMKGLTYHRLIIGFKGVGAQTSIGAGRGIIGMNDSLEKFALIAPSKPGLYKVRFRTVEGPSEEEALKKWKDCNCQEPGKQETIGLVYVRS